MHAGTGRISVILVGILAFLAAVIGDNIGFAAAHLGARRLVERFGRYILLTPERLDKATGLFKRHGGKVVTVARFIEGLRQANGVIEGITGMHWGKVPRLQRHRRRRPSVTVWTSVGYLSGNHINTIYNTANQYELDLAIALGAPLIAYIARRIYRSRKQPTATR
jgi:membrane protein DedA with SNARE-associated domain